MSDLEFLLDVAEIPQRLDGKTVLDIGTINGGAASAVRAARASRAAAVDISDEPPLELAAIRQFLGSNTRHVRASIFGLTDLPDEQFDVVLFWGVLYRLHHPLLALDDVRRRDPRQRLDRDGGLGSPGSVRRR